MATLGHTSGEWAYVINGTCRIGAVDEKGQTFYDDVTKGGGILHTSVPSPIDGS